MPKVEASNISTQASPSLQSALPSSGAPAPAPPVSMHHDQVLIDGVNDLLDKYANPRYTIPVDPSLAEVTPPASPKDSPSIFHNRRIKPLVEDILGDLDSELAAEIAELNELRGKRALSLEVYNECLARIKLARKPDLIAKITAMSHKQLEILRRQDVDIKVLDPSDKFVVPGAADSDYEDAPEISTPVQVEKVAQAPPPGAAVSTPVVPTVVPYVEPPLSEPATREASTGAEDPRTAWQYIKEEWLPTWPKVSLKLEDDDRTYLQRMTDAVKGFPDGIRSVAQSSIQDIKSMFKEYGIPKQVRKIISMLGTIFIMSLTDDPVVIYGMQAIMFMEYGVINTLVLDGLIYFVKQFRQRFTRPRDQGEGDEGKPTEEDLEEGGSLWNSITAFYSFIYSYTIGMLPDFVPKDAIKYLIGLNAAFTLARNVEHFGDFLLRMAKGALNFIWRLATGKPYFDQEQRRVLDGISICCAKANDILKRDHPTPNDIAHAKLLTRDLLTLSARAVLEKVNIDELKHVTFLRQQLEGWVLNYAAPAEFENPRTPTTLAWFLGSSGIGKSLLFQFLVAAISNGMNYAEALAHIVMRWQSDLNFQSKMPPNLKIVWFDDVYLVEDHEAHLRLATLLGQYGTSTPLISEGAAISDKENFARPDFAFGFDNQWTAAMGYNTQNAGARRHTGGIHTVILNEEFYKSETQKHLNLAKFSGRDWSALQPQLDAAWTFVDHLGVRRNFTELVSMLIMVNREANRGSRAVETMVATINESFKLSPKVVISSPPTSFHGPATQTINPSGTTREVSTAPPTVVTNAVNQGANNRKCPELTIATVFMNLPEQYWDEVRRVLDRFEAENIVVSHGALGLYHGSAFFWGAVSQHLVRIWNSVYSTHTVEDIVLIAVRNAIYDLDDNYDGVEDQSFVLRGRNEDFERWITHKQYTAAENKSLLERAEHYMKVSANTWVFADGKLTRDEVRVEPDFFHQRFIKRQEKKSISLCVKPDDWRAETFEEFRSKKFFTKGPCLRYGEYCYRHGSDTICESFDPDAQEVAFDGLCKWAVAQQDLFSRTPVYLMVSNAYVIDEINPKHTILSSILTALSVGAIAALCGVVLNQIWSYWRRTWYPPVPKDQAAYSYSAAMRSRRRGAEMPRLTAVGGKLVAPKNQGHIDQSQPKELPISWLVEKCGENTFPMSTFSEGERYNCQLFYIVGNFAVTVKHVFSDKFKTMWVGGLIAQELQIRYLDKLEQAAKVSTLVQVYMVPYVDIAVVIMPSSLPMASNDLRQYLLQGEVEPESLGAIVYAARKLRWTETGHPLLPEVLDPVMPHSVGNVKCAGIFDQVILRHGIYVDCPVPTLDGMCGFPAISTNMRVGRGHKLLCGIHGQYDAHSHTAIFAPLMRETVDTLLELIPEGVVRNLNPIKNQGYHEVIRMTPPTAETRGPLPENVVVAGILEPEDAQFQNKHNSIRESPISDCLFGLQVRDPVTNEKIEIPSEHVVQPSLLHVTDKPFLKMPTTNFVPKEEHIQGLKRAAEEVIDHVFRHSDPRHLKPRTRIFTTDEAINGIPELGYTALDPTKSTGHRPGISLKDRDKFQEQGPDGKWHLYAWAEQIVRKIHYDISINTPWPVVVAHLKEELRLIGKWARVTQCYDYLFTVAIRCYTLAIPSVIMSGKTLNGISVGSDQSGLDGHMAKNIGEAFDYSTLADAKNFDASKPSYVSEISEHQCAKILITQMPFLNWDTCVRIMETQRIVILVVGKYVIIRYHGTMSGHLLTTILNSLDTMNLTVYAWNESDHPTEASFFSAAFSQIYGDDMRVRHSHPAFTPVHVADIYTRFGMSATPVADKSGKVSYDFAAVDQDIHLRRRLVRQPNGYVMAPLELSVLSHIHAFIRGKDRNWRAAVHQNAEAALREWFLWGEDNYEKVKDRINSALREHKLTPIDLRYADLHAQWNNNVGGSLAHRPKSPKITGLDEYRPLSFVNQSAVASLTATAADGDSKMTARINTGALQSTGKPVVTSAKMTTHDDAVANEDSLMTKEAKNRCVVLNPNPPIGVEQAIMDREYQFPDVAWPRAGAADTQLLKLQFPEALLAMPFVKEKMRRTKFCRFNVKVTCRLNGNPFTSGCVKMIFIPYTKSTSWRTNPWLCLNQHWIDLSSAEPGSKTLECGYSANTNWYDVQLGAPQAANGTFVLQIAAAQGWNTEAPPDNLVIQTYAVITDLEMSGPDINEEIDLPFLHQSKNLPLNKLKNQSGLEEVKKVAAGSTIAGSSDSSPADSLLNVVGTALEAVKAVEPIIGLFDKPNALPVIEYAQITIENDMSNTSGLSSARTLSANPRPMVDANAPVTWETKHQPSWSDMIQNYGLIFRTIIPPNALSGAELLREKVHPAASWNVSGNYHMPTFLAWAGRYHRHWRGDIKYLIYLYSPVTQRFAVRVSHIPSEDTGLALAPNVRGDVDSKVFDVVGDTVIPYVVRYNRRWYQSNVAQIGGTAPNPTECNGEIVITVEQPISTGSTALNAGCMMMVYAAGDKNFQFSSPCNAWPNELVVMAPSTTEDAKIKASMKFMSQVRHKHLLNAKNQSSARDLSGLSPSTAGSSKSLISVGVCNPDQVRGPVDLLRRAHRRITDAPIEDNAVSTLNISDSDMWAQCLPWVGYSGSRIFTYYPSGENKSSQDIVVTSADRGNVGPAPLIPNTLAGTVWTDMRFQQMHKFLIPFEDVVSFHEADDSHAESEPILYWTRSERPASGEFNDHFDIFEQVGDDFSLYFLCAPPFLEVSAAAPARLTPAKRLALQTAFEAEYTTKGKAKK